MRKIQEYHLCWNPCPNHISDDVNRWIGLGFQPYGESFISKKTSGETIYCQAMVKYAGVQVGAISPM